MGFVFLDQYDVAACASLCNSRDADPVGGSCKYFDIWRALVDGVPTTYTCSTVGGEVQRYIIDILLPSSEFAAPHLSLLFVFVLHDR